MNAHSESRQEVLVATKYIFAAAKTKFPIARSSESKDQLSNPSLLAAAKIPPHYSKNTLS